MKLNRTFKAKFSILAYIYKVVSKLLGMPSNFPFCGIHIAYNYIIPAVSFGWLFCVWEVPSSQEKSSSISRPSNTLSMSSVAIAANSASVNGAFEIVAGF